MSPTDFPAAAHQAQFWQHALNWAPILAAFLGFTVGSYIVHRLNRRLERYKDAQKAKQVARALAAELIATKMDLEGRVQVLEKYKKQGVHNFGVSQLKSVILSLGRVDLHVYQANITNLGLLPRAISADLIKMSIELAGYDRMALSYVADVFDAGMDAVKATFDDKTTWSDSKEPDNGVKYAYSLIEKEFNRLLDLFGSVIAGLESLIGELQDFGNGKSAKRI